MEVGFLGFSWMFKSVGEPFFFGENVGVNLFYTANCLKIKLYFLPTYCPCKVSIFNHYLGEFGIS